MLLLLHWHALLSRIAWWVVLMLLDDWDAIACLHLITGLVVAGQIKLLLGFAAQCAWFLSIVSLQSWQ